MKISVHGLNFADFKKLLNIQAFNANEQFLPRDAVRKCGLCYRPVSVLLSVRPPVTLVYYIHKAEDIVKLFVLSSSPIILIFLTPSADTQFRGEPLQRERKIHGGWKICDFLLKSLFISETVRDRSMVAMERRRIYPCQCLLR